MKIIALTGYKRSGKDTVGDAIMALATERKESAVKLKFADPLREAVEKLTGCEPERVKGLPIWYGLTGRELMIALGNGVRSLREDFFATLLANRLERFESAGIEWAVITDLRFVNEAFMLVDRFDHVRIVRLDNPLAPHDPNDPAEREIDKIPVHLALRNVPGSTDPRDLARIIMRQFKTEV